MDGMLIGKYGQNLIPRSTLLRYAKITDESLKKTQEQVRNYGRTAVVSLVNMVDCCLTSQIPVNLKKMPVYTIQYRNIEITGNVSDYRKRWNHWSVQEANYFTKYGNFMAKYYLNKTHRIFEDQDVIDDIISTIQIILRK
jgi:hypothetical protein